MKELKGVYSPLQTKTKKQKMRTNNNSKHSAAVIALMAADRDGAYQTAAQAPVKSSCRAARFIASAAAGIALTFALANSASAQFLWDNTLNNPYVASGNGGQCTAFGEGRFKSLNGDWLRFVNPQGQAVYPNAGLMATYVVQTPTVYRDSVPVRGALISWSKPNQAGHAAVIERVYSNGSADISEQNWPTGSGPNGKTLTAAQLQSRPSTVNGVTSYYTLVGYVNPNRATAIGTLYTTKTSTAALQLDVALLDEDKRPLNVLVGIFAGGIVVSGTSASGTVNANSTLTVRWSNTSQWVRGKTYTITLWVKDFRGLRSSKSTTFIW